MSRLKRKYRVMVADDFAEHGIMLACAMRQTRALQVIHMVTTSREAIRYLIGKGCYADREKFPLPEVLVTELGMPCLEVLSLLAELRFENFRLPLRIVLTGSPISKHREEAKRLGADGYFTKPERFKGLVRIAREIEKLVLGKRGEERELAQFV